MVGEIVNWDPPYYSVSKIAFYEKGHLTDVVQNKAVKCQVQNDIGAIYWQGEIFLVLF